MGLIHLGGIYCHSVRAELLKNNNEQLTGTIQRHLSGFRVPEYSQ